MISKAKPIVFIILAGLLPNAGKCQASEAFLIQQDKPGAFVTFEKVVSGKPVFQGESGQRVVLRFHNNYRFPIDVPTFDLGSDLIGVTYQVRATKKKPGVDVPSGYWREVVTMHQLLPGQDLVFSVPAEHLSDSTYLQIPFTIEWETKVTKGGAAPEHFAVFYGASLPKIGSGR